MPSEHEVKFLWIMSLHLGLHYIVIGVPKTSCQMNPQCLLHHVQLHTVQLLLATEAAEVLRDAFHQHHCLLEPVVERGGGPMQIKVLRVM